MITLNQSRDTDHFDDQAGGVLVVQYRKTSEGHAQPFAWIVLKPGTYTIDRQEINCPAGMKLEVSTSFEWHPKETRKSFCDSLMLDIR